MYYNLICFLKFIVHEINSEIVKSGMVVQTERWNTDMTNTDVAVSWVLQPAGKTMICEREKKLT
jgi:hypothetical protein